MILKSARVQDYKCIEDSDTFTVSDITCLVGKNESGKTALLHALYKLSPVFHQDGKYDELNEYPRRKLADYRKKGQSANVATTVWQLCTSEKDALAGILGPEGVEKDEIEIKKGYDGARTWSIALREKKVVDFYLEKVDLTDEERCELESCDTVQTLVEALKAKEKPSEGQSELLESLTANFKRGTAVKGAIDALDNYLPKFLYFSDYYNLPGAVSMNELQRRKEQNRLEDSDKVFLALLELVGYTPEELNSAEKFEELTAKLEAISNRLSQDIFTYWSQNKHLEVVFTFDMARPGDPPPFNEGFIFRTRIKNRKHQVTVSFDERSSGFIWFFSFLVWFSQLKQNYGERLIILLDEPGLKLHAKAQSDLLKYINERLRPDHQVIYCTHSPFMIDPDCLMDVRTIEDKTAEGEIRGTKVGDRVLSTDRDTVFPLQAALGYDITQTLFVGSHNLLVEGPSDLLYLKWFSAQLGNLGRTALDLRWTICPTGGIDKIAGFVSLFSGKELDMAVFTDYRTGKKGRVKSLRESELLKEGNFLTADSYTDKAEADIEDILAPELYCWLVNKSYNLKGKSKVSSSAAVEYNKPITEYVAEHFRTLTDGTPEYTHFTPAEFLTVNGKALIKDMPQLEVALSRFERLFSDLNHLLPTT